MLKPKENLIEMQNHITEEQQTEKDTLKYLKNICLDESNQGNNRFLFTPSFKKWCELEHM